MTKNISRFTKNIFNRSLPLCPSCARAADAMASRRSASMARFVWRLWGGAARDRGLYSSSLILWRHQTYTGIWTRVQARNWYLAVPTLVWAMTIILVYVSTLMFIVKYCHGEDNTMSTI